MPITSTGYSGIYHIHSDYSYDGVNNLEKIAEWGEKTGLRFIFLTEHDLGFDQVKFDRFRDDCEKYSRDILLVPGIEYEVIHLGEIVHIGAIGVSRFLDPSINRKGILALVNAIHACGGLAVLHHPNNIRHVLEKKHLECFDFVELWNTKFDCEFAPNKQFVRWMNDQDYKGSYLVSADIHNVAGYSENRVCYIDITQPQNSSRVQDIVDGLAERKYSCRRGKWIVLPDGSFSVPNGCFRILPAVCSIKKRIFRFARYFIPEKYRKAVFKFVNKAWIR
jgi:hypothetical protein